MRINLLFGFLGSGKTTLVRRILAERGGDRPMAVIVNEFGEVGVDGDIIAGKNVDLVELTSGCLCCTLRGSLMSAVEELEARAGVEHIVVEATGVASPGDMVEDLLESKLESKVDIAPLVTVVDTPKFTRLQQMLGEFYEEQVENADIIVLSKIDLADRAAIDEAHAAVRELNPDAAVLYSEHGDADLALLLDGEESVLLNEMRASADEARHGEATHELHHDHAHDHEHGHPHSHAPADSFVLDFDAGFDRARLEAAFAGLDANVWRVKGFVNVDGEGALVQYTMGQLEIEPCAPRERARLVVIGHDPDRDAVTEAFEAALERGASS